MSWDLWLFLFCVTCMSAFTAVTLYEWVKAERDERQWRKMIEEEADLGAPTFTYRLVREERSDRG